MNRSASTSPIGSRALEYAIIAAIALLAADAVRSDLGPVWRTLCLLLGI
ncbi:MAG: hypothetical protein M3O07_09255 [Pseudomonadota bacterium]|nr:hypothetical protein [Pseudomonadota bacterium]